MTPSLGDIYHLFELFDRWSGLGAPGHWPDGDLLALGKIGMRSPSYGTGEGENRLTEDEQLLVMTLWTMARSPLMFAGEMRDMDEWTSSLLTNEEVLDIQKHSRHNRQLFRRDDCVAWTAEGTDGSVFLALFNLNTAPKTVTASLSELGLHGRWLVRDLWRRRDLETTSTGIGLEVAAHGARLLQLKAQKQSSG